MRLVIFLAVTCFMCTCVVKKQDDKYIRQSFIPRQYTVDIDSLISSLKPDAKREVLIRYDPNVPGIKQYRGISLGEQLKQVLELKNLSAGNWDVVLVCKDGYAPVRPATELINRLDGYIVFKDLAAAEGTGWTTDMQKAFSPFYLVWQTDSIRARELPWPYGLTNIKLIERDSVLVRRISANAAVFAGYHLFRKYCFSCHAINKTGGQVGPEMNWPKSITEYWTDKNIKHYIRDPRSFRYNARMPAMTQVNDQDMEDIIKYLHYMQQHKLRE